MFPHANRTYVRILQGMHPEDRVASSGRRRRGRCRWRCHRPGNIVSAALVIRAPFGAGGRGGSCGCAQLTVARLGTVAHGRELCACRRHSEPSEVCRSLMAASRRLVAFVQALAAVSPSCMRSGHAGCRAHTCGSASWVPSGATVRPAQPVPTPVPTPPLEPTESDTIALVELYALNGYLDARDSDQHIAAYVSTINAGLEYDTRLGIHDRLVNVNAAEAVLLQSSAAQWVSAAKDLAASAEQLDLGLASLYLPTRATMSLEEREAGVGDTRASWLGDGPPYTPALLIKGALDAEVPVTGEYTLMAGWSRVFGFRLGF